MKPIYWKNSTASGLGDRLIDFLKMVAYAKTLGTQLYVKWEPYVMKDIDAIHRKNDIDFENVKNHINFPNNVVFINRPPNPEDVETFINYLGGDPLPSGFMHIHLHGISPELFMKNYDIISKEFSFCPEITNFLNSVSVPFVSFQIRRSDKVRFKAVDTTMIADNEIDELNTLTFKAIDFYIAKGYNNFFICGDEDTKNIAFIEYLQKKGKNLLSIPKMEKWRSTYFDLAMMTKADHVIISNRNSAFGFFASIIGKRSARTVYQLYESGEVNPHIL